MKSKLIILTIACLLIWFYVLVLDRSYVGYYYPYGDDLSIYTQSDSYLANQEDCRWWAYREDQKNMRDGALYSCGYDCTESSEEGEYRCTNFTKNQAIDVLD